MKKQNELIEKLVKKVNTHEEHIISLEGKLAVTETVNNLLEKKADTLEDHASSCQAWKKKKKYGEPDRSHHWQTGTD